MSKRGAPYGRVPVVVGLIAFLIVGALSFTSPTVVRAAPGDVGQAGPSFAGSGADPTGTKPEAKIWFNDGFWWASMYRATASAFTIHRLSGTTWTDTGVVIDDRENTHSDALWDQAAGKLYIASHIYTAGGNSSGNPARLYRYTYNAGTDTYAPDGAPQTITDYSTETLVIDKDSTGQLWATWTRGSVVRVNRTTSGDQNWGAEFIPAVNNTSVSSDDIATLVAFGGDKIGLLWSKQNGSPASTDAFHFSVHQDSAGDTTWGAETPVFAGTDQADDHLNLKADPAGNLFAVVKTSLTSGANLVVLRRSAAGTWTNATFSTGQGTMTRGVLAVDTTNNLLHVFATAPESNGTIYEKTSPLSSLSFAGGLGTPFIRDNSQDDLNNATTAKGTVNSTTGLLVLAGHETLNEYWFNVDPPVGGGGPTPTPGTTITLNPTEDAQVRSNAATTNYGSLSTFRTREEATGDTYRSYVKFNVSGITGTVNSVKLRLFTTDASSNVQTVASVDPNAWAENTVNWNNKPAFGTVRGSGAVPTVNAYNEITLSPAMITGNVPISIGIQSASSNSAIFTSSEGAANQPQLVITQTVASGPPPIADPSSQSTLQGQPVTFDLTGSDVDTCGLTFAISVAPTKGAVSAPNSAAGCTVGSPNTDSASVTYTPSPASTGADQFTFTVSDGVNPPVSAVVSLTIGARPTANAGSASTPQDTPASVSLTGGDLETCDLTFAFTQPAHGTVSSLVNNACVGTGPFTDSASVTYTPEAGYNGPDSFTFTTNDATATSASATISLTVGTTPDAPPTADPVTKSTPHDVGSTVTLSGSDADDCQLAFVAPATGPAHGSLGTVTNANCVAGSPNTDSATVVYTPTAGYSGPDSFTYTVDDGTNPPASATVSITVTNAAPTANGSSQTTLQGTPKTFDLTGTDADDCTLTFAVVTSPTKGNLSAPAAAACTPGSPNTDRASVTYTPTAGQTGADSFTFTVSDGVSTSAAATVNLTITPSGGTPTTFTPMADSKVKSDSPNNNYGTLTQMQTRAAAPTTPTIWRPYMRFNVTGSGTVTGVKIRLWVDTGSPDGGTVYAAVDSAWTDTSITWNNAPVPGAALGALGSTSAKVGTWVEVDLGAGAVTGNGTYTFVIQTTSSTSGQLSSKEGAHPPELVVTRSP